MAEIKAGDSAQAERDNFFRDSGDLDKAIRYVKIQNTDPISVTIPPGSFDGLEVVVSNEVEIKNDLNNPVPISVSSLPLPSGASTETTLASVLSAVDQVETKLDSLLTELQDKTEPTDNQLVQATNLDIRDLAFLTDKVDVTGSVVALDATSLAALENINVTVTSIGEVEIKNDAGSPVPISAASLPLPAGASTAANQTTANASLASIDAGIPVALGQTTMANSMPVVIASDQTLNITSTNGLANKTTFVVNTGPITGATAIGTKSLAYLFHGILNVSTYKLISIVVDQIAGNGAKGAMRIEMNRITAEALIPGGTAGTKKGKLASDISLATFVINPTNAPTREAGACFGVNSDVKSDGQTMPVGFNGIEGIEQKPWTINPLTSFGFEITQVNVSALSTAPIFNITFEWDEA